VDEGVGNTVEAAGGLKKPSVVTWLRLARVYHRVDRASAEHLSAWGLSVGQFDVLAQVGAHEGVTQNQLAGKLLVTKTKRLYLTEEGRSLFDEVVPSQEDLVDRLLSPVPAEEHGLLSKILGRLDRAPR
jgi:DNA-binding MarR family transcriptional regulator